MCTKTLLYSIAEAVYSQAVSSFGDKLDAVILYGSYARGDFDDQSDIDLMVRVNEDKTELKKYRKAFVHLCSELGLAHNVFVSVHLQDMETFSRYKEALPFYQNVEREGVRIGA